MHITEVNIDVSIIKRQRAHAYQGKVSFCDDRKPLYFCGICKPDILPDGISEYEYTIMYAILTAIDECYKRGYKEVLIKHPYAGLEDLWNPYIQVTNLMSYKFGSYVKRYVRKGMKIIFQEEIML
jgi:hypothetical protein